jgi:hypothetical protein
MTGGWRFCHALALQSSGWQPVIVCALENVDGPTRMTHLGTGAPIWAVPARPASRMPIAPWKCIEPWLRSPMADFAATLAKEQWKVIVVQ